MEITAFECVVLRVGNARAASNYFITKYGFEPVAESCLETGNRSTADIVVKLNDIQIMLSSDVSQQPTVSEGYAKHREHVADVALTVTNLDKAYNTRDDEFPSVNIPMKGSISHSLVDASTGKIDWANKTGWRTLDADPLNKRLPPTGLLFIDHVVSNYPEGEMEKQCEWYEKNFGMHRFWSVDETQVHTEYSALRSVVMASPNERVKLPINEPAPSSLKGKSQIQEYLDYNMGPGVQHIALRTDDIIQSVRALRARGLKFYHVPSRYYTDLKERLSKSKCVIKEDMKVLEELQILVDFDDNGYLLQIFTESFDYRPTLFFEIIQRNNHEGFGVGNFKALFECIEAEQAKRGNL